MRNRSAKGKVRETEEKKNCSAGENGGKRKGSDRDSSGKEPAPIRILRRIAERLADVVFPPDIYCISCGRPVLPGEVYSLCSDCLQEIHWANGKLCCVCGKPLEDWYPRDICGECVNRERSFDGGITCVQYGTAGRRILRDFKYRGKSWMARELAEIIYDKISAVGLEFDIIIPVPMYAAKERERGYNQAALLGTFLGRRSGKDFRRDCLLRIRDTVPMNKLGAKDRRKNLQGAFRVTAAGRQIFPGKRVLLIDDIYTTGTTAEYCSALMKECGARSVTVATVAAGRNQRELPRIRIEGEQQTEQEAKRRERGD